MKKFFKTLFAFTLCFCTLLSFTACKPNLSTTTADTQNVTSNGGISVRKDGYLYFVNGTKAVSDADIGGNVVNGGIYRVKLDDNGEILYDTTTDDDGNEIKTIHEIQPVVNKLVGFKYGSLNIFGDFLYYTTPNTDVNKSGDMLTGKVEFRRYDLVNKVDQMLYVTKASDDVLSFNFVKQDDKLYLCVFEKNSATLTSLLIGDKVKTAFVKKEVKSAIFSEEEGTNADKYMYFTLSYDKKSELKRGVRVYKVLPDGTGEDLLSEGKDVTLLTVKAGRLIYAYDSAVYSANITAGDDSLVFGENDIVCSKNYENIIFLEVDEKLSVLVYEDEVLRLITWDNDKLTYNNLHEFDSEDELAFIGTDGDFVVYTIAKKVYKSRFKNLTEENQDEKMPIQLSLTEVIDADELMAPEIVNGYLYGFVTNETTSKTYLYRISLDKPDEVKAAEFIGIAE
ncbi:MAG: DUF5050 domain-containing protein [Clostridia bacterium]|nr:DUF5050 domain-containing protein [Clostridia bacterium]